ncbi:MAG: Rrf2 family transcriptional regulator [Lachnospiraceae bacterium]|nr:Rrf2 family transcriptional regulator [Lachnospiraceae bacterium]
MKISTKGRYALRLMLDLATYNTGEPVSLKNVASRQEISEKYLEQIISILNKAGFVKSIRGASGGYFLAKEPREYTVGMILRLTEGDLTTVDYKDESEVGNGYVTVKVWQKMDEAINGVIDSITLEDLKNWQTEENDFYSI